MRWARLIISTIVVLLLEISLLASDQHQSPKELPSEQDEVQKDWTSRRKYYIAIAANLSKPGSLPFVERDLSAIGSMLKTAGYKPLVPPMSGQNANYQSLEDALKKVNGLPDRSVVLVYFSGHGKEGPAQVDVYLQLFDYPISVTQIVRLARDEQYMGELAVIVDACETGAAVWNTDLKDRDFQVPTSTLVSSSTKRNSHPIVTPEGNQMSAFTYVLTDGVAEKWRQIDDNEDGFLEYRELKLYARNELFALCTQEPPKVLECMVPEGRTDEYHFLAYDPRKVSKHDSPLRRHYLNQVRQAQLASELDTAAKPIFRKARWSAPAISDGARIIAAKIEDSDTVPDLLRAMKATSERRFADARTILQKVIQEQPMLRGQAYWALARNELYAGRPKDAAAYFQQARSYLPFNNAGLVGETGNALALAGELDEAPKYYEPAIWALTQAQEQSSLQRAAILSNNLGWVYRSTGNVDKAETKLRDAVSISKTYFGQDSLTTITSSSLAEFYSESGKQREPRSLWRRIWDFLKGR